MITITESIAINESELEETFVRSSGPGGQHVNKVATAVQLRFDVKNSPSLPDEVKQRLLQQAGKRMTAGGVLFIEARRYRSQERNRQDAIARLRAIIARATVTPKPRRKTKPTKASIEERLQKKKQRSEIKRLRQDAPQVD